MALVFFRLAPVSRCNFDVLFCLWRGGFLWATENAYAFIFVISSLLSLPILFLAVFIFKIYEDVRRVEGFLPAVEVNSPASPKIKTAPVSTGLSSFEELLRSSWGLYQRRFIPLSILNLISCLPHGMHILILLAGYFGLKTFFDAGIKGTIAYHTIFLRGYPCSFDRSVLVSVSLPLQSSFDLYYERPVCI
jgi:hypothetical protein